MAALFPEWTNTAFRLGLAGLALAALGVPTALVIFMHTPYVTDERFPVDQPEEFDHRHHVRDDGIDCRYCHSTVEKSAYASVPATATCMNCHSQVWNDSPLIEPVRRSFFTATSIPWRRVHKLPDYVYFNHAIHVNKGIGCVSCHGRVDEMARVEQVAPLTMGWCLDCHRAPEKNLRPRDEITSMTWRAEDPEATARALAAQYRVRHLTNCTTCHR